MKQTVTVIMVIVVPYAIKFSLMINRGCFASRVAFGIMHRVVGLMRLGTR